MVRWSGRMGGLDESGGSLLPPPRGWRRLFQADAGAQHRACLALIEALPADAAAPEFPKALRRCDAALRRRLRRMFRNRPERADKLAEALHAALARGDKEAAAQLLLAEARVSPPWVDLSPLREMLSPWRMLQFVLLPPLIVLWLMFDGHDHRRMDLGLLLAISAFLVWADVLWAALKRVFD